MYEYRGNMHVHTCYSDGSGTHDDVARAAIDAGLDFVFTTDHNVWVSGLDGYYYSNQKKVLLLAGEEIHDPVRDPQKNHLLVYGAGAELAKKAPDPQELIDAVRESGGLCFLAHPHDPEAPRFHEPNLSWVDWRVHGYTGIELWNAMSEFKGRLSSILSAVWYAYFPSRIALAPFPQTLAIWDRLLNTGQKVIAIAGADAHAGSYSMGPFTRTLFPYDFHFRAINTHVLTADPLTGDVQKDRDRILDALKNGSCFPANDQHHPSDGFRFTAESDHGTIQMGQTSTIRFGVTMQIRLPAAADIRLLRNGMELHTWRATSHAVLPVTKPGIYRVEVYSFSKGKNRGWIYSNPIYLQATQDY
ncbi:MAG: CehA/McbA family metallohydrolase [Anaerolineales bacterium]|nr:CehA/McbA family metallohydrolase [Anaerolineales bacterium]